MIKKNFCDALKRFISTNIISVRASGSIEQKKPPNRIDTESDKGFTFSINHHISKIEIEIEIKIKIKIKNQNCFFTYSEPRLTEIFVCKIKRDTKFCKKKNFSEIFFSLETFFKSD